MRRSKRALRMSQGLALMGAALVLTACAQSGPAVAPASGVVTLDGKPLAGATVTLIADLPASTREFPPTASGRTDEMGRFTLQIGVGMEGAVPGKYKVVVSQVVAKEGATLQEGIDVRQLMMSGQAEEKLPPTYSDPLQTTLTVEVPPEGSDALKLELTGG